MLIRLKSSKFNFCCAKVEMLTVFWPQSRSRRPEVFCKKGVLENFTGKHLCHSLFFNKVAGLRPVTLLEKRLWHRCFPVSFVKFSKTPFFIDQLRRLLLPIYCFVVSNGFLARSTINFCLEFLEFLLYNNYLNDKTSMKKL